MKGRHQRRRPSKTTTTKCIVWACLINGIGWVWCSYVLAFLGRTEIAESLRPHADGFYFMTPFNRAEIVAELIEKCREM
mgnify:CR=1 FL=1